MGDEPEEIEEVDDGDESGIEDSYSVEERLKCSILNLIIFIYFHICFIINKNLNIIIKNIQQNLRDKF
jgi:hypothetical protein